MQANSCFLVNLATISAPKVYEIPLSMLGFHPISSCENFFWNFHSNKIEESFSKMTKAKTKSILGDDKS